MMNKILILIFLAFSTSLLSAGYSIKDYKHLVGNLDGINPSTLEMHLTLYQGYVKNTNALEEMLSKTDDRSIAYGALKRRFAWEFDGMVLHELYFENLGGKSSLQTKSALYKAIEKDFGSFEKWRQNFFETGMICGIGWVILYIDPINKQLHNIWVDDHHVNHIAGGVPLLVMDVWEHAYITECGLNRGGYIDAFYKNIDCKAVETRYSQGILK